jgi:hypothetical protein
MLHALPQSQGSCSDQEAPTGFGTAAAMSTEGLAGNTRRRYCIHGVEIELVAGDPWTLESVHSVLEHLGLLPGASDTLPSVILRFSAKSEVRVPCAARILAEQGGIRAWIWAGSLYLTCPGYACRLDTGAGVGEWSVPPLSAQPRKDIITYGLLLLLRRFGLYALHGSGVARDGVGLLFAAPSGSGKSTLAYSLVRQGWEYLSDDALLLRTRGEEIDALALRRGLCLDPSLVHAFPEVSELGEDGAFAGKGKRLLHMQSLHHDRLVECCVPRVLVFPEIVSHRTSRLVPLDSTEAFMRLTQQSAVVTLDRDVVPCHLQALERLIRQACGYRLLAGQDLNGHPEAVAALFAGIHASFVCAGA